MYTEEEKRILLHTSNINSNIFVPFMSVDLQEQFVFPIPFTDKVSYTTKYYVIHDIEPSIPILGWLFRTGTKAERTLC